MPTIDLPADGEQPYGVKLRTAINAVNDAVDDNTAEFNDREIYSYRWADSSARTGQAGMRAGDKGYQVDTNAEYTYTGTEWEIHDTGWIEPTLINSWTQSGAVTVGYRRVGETVNMRGRVTGGTTGAAFVLPEGFRPDQRGFYGVLTGASGSTITVVTLQASGNVEAVSGALPNFDAISFPRA